MSPKANPDGSCLECCVHNNPGDGNSLRSEKCWCWLGSAEINTQGNGGELGNRGDTPGLCEILSTHSDIVTQLM